MRRVGAQAGAAAHDGAHQFVGVQAALHQQFGAPFARQLHGLVGGGVAVLDIDDLVRRDVEAELAGDFLDLGARPDQQRQDDAFFGGLDGAAQRAFVAGMGDGGRRRGQFPAAGEQAFVFGVLLFHGESPKVFQ